MFKKLIITIVLLFVYSGYLAQKQRKIDSLQIIIKEAKEDTLKVNAIIGLSFEMRKNGDFEKSIELSEEAKDLSEKLNYNKGILGSLKNLGAIYYTQKNYKNALDYYLKALKIAEYLVDNAAASSILNNLGMIYEDQSNYEKAIDCHEKSLRIKEKINDKKGQANSYLQIGSIYKAKNDLNKALEYYQISLKICEEINDKELISRVFNNIGTSYERISDYTKALEFYNKSLAVKKEIGDKTGITITLNNIANINKIQGNYVKALQYYFEVLSVWEEIKDKKRIINALNNIGNTYGELNDYNQALSYFEKALKLSGEIGEEKQVVMCLINLGSNYKSLKNNLKASELYFIGLKKAKKIEEEYLTAVLTANIADLFQEKKDFFKSLDYYNRALVIFRKLKDKNKEAAVLHNIGKNYFEQQNYKDGLAYFTQSLKIAKEIVAVNLIKETEASISEAYEHLNDTVKSLEHYKQFVSMKDSLMSETKNRQIIEIQTKYETKKQQQEIELLNKEKKLKQTQLANRNLIIIGVVLLSLLLFVLYNRQKLATENQKLTLGKQVVELEQKLLRLQMNPHFVFNALSALQGLINIGEKQKASMYLSHIAKLIRAILENSRHEYILLIKEIETIENYLKVNQLLLDNQFDYQLQFDETLHSDNISIPPMLMQPFIENALLHGIQNVKQKGLIKIRLIKNKNNILFEVEDNGVGVTASNNENAVSHESLSTQITKERLANILKVPINNIVIHISEIKNSDLEILGTKTSFEIPIKYS